MAILGRSGLVAVLAAAVALIGELGTRNAAAALARSWAA